MTQWILGQSRQDDAGQHRGVLAKVGLQHYTLGGRTVATSTARSPRSVQTLRQPVRAGVIGRALALRTGALSSTAGKLAFAVVMVVVLFFAVIGSAAAADRPGAEDRAGRRSQAVPVPAAGRSSCSAIGLVGPIIRTADLVAHLRRGRQDALRAASRSTRRLRRRHGRQVEQLRPLPLGRSPTTTRCFALWHTDPVDADRAGRRHAGRPRCTRTRSTRSAPRRSPRRWSSCPPRSRSSVRRSSGA